MVAIGKTVRGNLFPVVKNHKNKKLINQYHHVQFNLFNKACFVQANIKADRQFKKQISTLLIGKCIFRMTVLSKNVGASFLIKLKTSD